MNGDAGRKAKVSAIMVVRNEAAKIRRCLESVKWTDEIIVVDQSSTDETVRICREYTDKVFVVPVKYTANPDREAAASKAANEWVYLIDADEVMSDALRDEILTVLRDGPRFASYYVSRHNFFMGELVRGSGWYPNYIIRLFRKDAVVYTPRVHQELKPLSQSGRLESPLLHYTYDTLEDYLGKVDRFTKILARQAYERGKRVNALTACSFFLYLPVAYAAQKFLLMRGYRDGFRGVLIAWFTFLTVFTMYAKLRGIQRGKAYGLPEEYLEHINRDTTIRARERYEKGKRVTALGVPVDFMCAPMACFAKELIRRRGLTDGFSGILRAFYALAATFVTNAKIWGLQVRETAEKKHDS